MKSIKTPTSNDKPLQMSLKVETLVLVAVWDNPFIFQGCIKITELPQHHKVFYFFRCESSHREQKDILNNDFAADDYVFTHLYNELGFIPLDHTNPIKEYALDMMSYALHITLREMISNRKIHCTSIDDVAMQAAMMDKIKPILSRDLALPEEEHLGFEVAMNFSPQEEMGYWAAQALLNNLTTQKQSH